MNKFQIPEPREVKTNQRTIRIFCGFINFPLRQTSSTKVVHQSEDLLKITIKNVNLKIIKVKLLSY